MGPGEEADAFAGDDNGPTAVANGSTSGIDGSTSGSDGGGVPDSDSGAWGTPTGSGTPLPSDAPREAAFSESTGGGGGPVRGPSLGRGLFG